MTLRNSCWPMSRDPDKWVQQLCRAFTDPLLVYPPEDPSLIPQDLKFQITAERLAQTMNAGYGGSIEEATDSEALLYLMTVSFAAPFNQDWYGIYTHLFGKYAERRGVRLPEDLREDVERYRELGDHRLRLLNDLKRWIQKQKDKAYRERRRQPRSEEPERNPFRQLTLDLYAEEFKQSF